MDPEKLAAVNAAWQGFWGGWRFSLVIFFSLMIALSLPGGESGGDPDVSVTVIVNK